jgi:hypothetical protein
LADNAIPAQNLDRDGRHVEGGPVATASPAFAADLEGPSKGAECYSLVFMWVMLFRFLVYMADGSAASARFLVRCAIPAGPDAASFSLC